MPRARGGFSITVFHHYDLWETNCRQCSDLSPTLPCRHLDARRLYRRLFQRPHPHKVVCAGLCRPFRKVRVVEIYAGWCASCRYQEAACQHYRHRKAFESMIEDFLTRVHLLPTGMNFNTFIDENRRTFGPGFDTRLALEERLEWL